MFTEKKKTIPKQWKFTPETPYTVVILIYVSTYTKHIPTKNKIAWQLKIKRQ